MSRGVDLLLVITLDRCWGVAYPVMISLRDLCSVSCRGFDLFIIYYVGSLLCRLASSCSWSCFEIYVAFMFLRVWPLYFILTWFVTKEFASPIHDLVAWSMYRSVVEGCPLYYCNMLILLAGALPHSCCADLLSDRSSLAPPIGLRREWVTVRLIQYSLFFGRLLLRWLVRGVHSRARHCNSVLDLWRVDVCALIGGNVVLPTCLDWQPYTDSYRYSRPGGLLYLHYWGSVVIAVALPVLSSCWPFLLSFDPLSPFFPNCVWFWALVCFP